MSDFDKLWKYCTSNNRICPIPQKWNELFDMLHNKKQKSSGVWEPPLPLILAAWYDTPALSKQLRLKEHLEWAQKEKQLDDLSNFLYSLKEEEWFHLGE